MGIGSLTLTLWPLPIQVWPLCYFEFWPILLSLVGPLMSRSPKLRYWFWTCSSIFGFNKNRVGFNLTKMPKKKPNFSRHRLQYVKLNALLVDFLVVLWVFWVLDEIGPKSAVLSLFRTNIVTPSIWSLAYPQIFNNRHNHLCQIGWLWFWACTKLQRFLPKSDQV